MQQSYNDITGIVFAAIGSIYGIVLAFVVVEVWTQYFSAQTVANQESSEAYALYRDLNLHLNRAQADTTQAVLRKFILSVVRDEYPAIKAMKWESNYQSCLATQRFLNDFLASIRLIFPSTSQEQSLFNEILKHASGLEMSRVQRRLSAQSGLPGMLWAD